MNLKLISSLLLAASLFFVVCLASSSSSSLSSSSSTSTTTTTPQPSKSFVEFFMNNNNNDLAHTRNQNVTTLKEEAQDDDTDNDVDDDEDDEEFFDVDEDEEDENDEDEEITTTANNSTLNNRNSSIVAIARTAGWFARMLTRSREATTEMVEPSTMRTNTNLLAPGASQSRSLGLLALILGPLIGLTIGKALLRGLIWAVLAYALHLFFPSVLSLLGLGTGLVGFARQMRPDYAQMIVHTLINLHDEFHRLPPVNVGPNQVTRHY